MFVLTYRNTDGNLRVSPRAYATAAQAGGFAQYYLRRSAEFAQFRGSLMVVDLSETIAKAEEHAAALAENPHLECGGCAECMDMDPYYYDVAAGPYDFDTSIF